MSSEYRETTEMRRPPIAPGPIGGVGLVVLDELMVLDAFPEADSKVFARERLAQIGGPVTTALSQLSRLGFETAILSSWGDDLAGRAIEAAMVRAGIGFDAAWCRTATSSGVAHVWIEPATGRRTVVSAPPGVQPRVSDAVQFAASLKALHVDGWGGEAAIAAAESAKSSGALVTFDCGSVKPATERLLALADVVNAPRRFVRAFVGTEDLETGARLLLARGPRLVTITDGPRGAGFYTADESGWRPAFRADAIDTCGAGDVFCGGLIAALLEGAEPSQALRFAMSAAAFKIARWGNDELATRGEILGRLAENPE